MPQCKKNPLKVNETKFLSLSLEKGRYVKRYYFSNGLGASVVCHSGSYGGNEGRFELAILEYDLGSDPEMTSKIIEQHPVHENHGAVDVFGWLDFFEVANLLQEIRNYSTGNYWYEWV